MSPIITDLTEEVERQLLEETSQSDELRFSTRSVSPSAISPKMFDNEMYIRDIGEGESSQAFYSCSSSSCSRPDPDDCPTCKPFLTKKDFELE